MIGKFANELNITSMSLGNHKTQKLIYAHRGSWSDRLEENTMRAFNRAVEIGAHGIEADLRLTKDQEVVLFHDQKINQRLVKSLSLQELQQIKPDITTLNQLLELPLSFNLDIKDPTAVHLAAELVLEKELVDRVVLTGGALSCKILCEQYPQLKTGLSFDTVTRRTKSQIKELKPDFICVNEHVVNPLYMWYLSKLTPAPALAWTVNSESRMRQILKSRHVGGIMTDRPELALSVRASLMRQELVNA